MFGRRCSLLRFCLCLSILPSCFFLCLSTLPPFLTSPTVLPPFILSFDLPSPHRWVHMLSPKMINLIYTPPFLWKLFIPLPFMSTPFLGCFWSVHRSFLWVSIPEVFWHSLKILFLKHENIIAPNKKYFKKLRHWLNLSYSNPPPWVPLLQVFS